MSSSDGERHVALTFDVDAISLWLGSYKSTNASMVSRGEFDVQATARILQFLAERGIRATFFVPGHTALAFPETIRSIIAGGHEIGHHGFVHERITDLSPVDELNVLERGIEILSDFVGRQPVGYRSPSWEFTEHTAGYLVEHGFRYDSSLMASDYVPYWVRSGDRFSETTPYEFGTTVPLLEIPISWALDDFPHFEFVRGGVQSMKAPSQVLEIWAEDFRYFHDETEGGCWTLTMHPQVIGRGHRFRMLRRLVDEISSHPDTKFVTLEEASTSWIERHGEHSVEPT